MRFVLVSVVVVGMLAGCPSKVGPVPAAGSGSATATASANGALVTTLQARTATTMAALPDHGSLLAYDRRTARLVRGAYTWHPVQLSEAHALRAVVDGELALRAPDGRLIRLRYERHVEHPDGNWTWIGREPGAMPGTEAIITFGEKAVFGSVPNGNQPPLGLRMAAGRAWLVETDHAALATMQAGSRRARAPDFLPAPRLSAAPTASAPGAVAALSGATSSLATDGTTVDVLLGYTGGFATALGGQSQALTRLNYLVDIANQALANSQVNARFRLVGTRQVSYTDATSNQQALYDLTGVECTDTGSGLDCVETGIPAALLPLHEARELYGADLVSLVRDFNEPENEGCGIAWLNGGGLVGVSSMNENTGLSVVSDGTEPGPEPGTLSLCRDETLAHELGHNMGSTHDVATSDANGNGIEQHEKGAYEYSFGYRTAPGSGDFYTVMAYPEDRDSPPYQVSYRVFSNPAITFCGGRPCGVANQADNARSLRQTMPVVATFRASADPAPVGLGNHFSGDFDGDGRSDILWHNESTGYNSIWRSGSKATPRSVARIINLQWHAAALGDFDGDGMSDILWRNVDTGANTIWRSARNTTLQAVAGVPDVEWQAVGAGDFNGDGKSDILWRNAVNGANVIWRSANKATPQGASSVTNLQWLVAGIADFNGDGKDDILWRNTVTGANTIWKSGNSATLQGVNSVTNLQWQLVGAGDFNGDGKADILWRNTVTGGNTIWRSASSATLQTVTRVANVNWRVAGVGDFNEDGKADIQWRDFATGANSIWRSASSSSYQATASVTDLAWIVAP